MIGFAGLSHLGIVSSIATGAQGFQVIGYDSDPARCDALRQGHLPVFEPGLDDLLASSRSRIQFTADRSALGQCELLFLALDVATDRDGRSDLTPLHRLIEETIVQTPPDSTLVVLSQVSPGFTRGIAETFARHAHGRGRSLFYQVETLVFGLAVERALRPERFIVGCRDPRVPFPTPYDSWLKSFHCPVLPMLYESAELAKISINMCLVASVSVANTLAELCEAIGADWSEIVPALRLDRRIGPYAYLQPGLGIAGGNLERDLVTVKGLAEDFGTDAGVVDAWLSNSRYRRDWVLRTIHEEVIPHRANPVVAVWGLAYKPDTTSTKNSPALGLIEALGPFSVRAYDPQVVLNDKGSANLHQVGSALEACRGADVLAIMTPWREFSSVSLPDVRETMKGRMVIDPFGALDGRRCAELGFSHVKLGATARSTERMA